MVEIAREALEPYGHTVRYVTVSWARGLKQAEVGELNGVIGAIPEEAPSFVFGPPIGTYEDIVVFRRGEARDISELSSFEGLRVGAINGYEYFGPVNDYIEANRNDRSLIQYASGNNALATNLRKLVAGRLDVVAEVRAVLDYNVVQLGLSDAIEVVGTTDSDDVFIAFSPALESSQTYARQLSEGVARLKENGRYDEIFRRYGLNPAST
ncbi:MAG: transporter substrate-binding domain-containing protein [Silicimonas sp.]|nr:transporter substrate-binding domain-containing protein [Silicimonas sp.]